MVYKFKCAKAKIYINTKKKSLAAIKAETGCDVVINGGLYNMTTFKPVCHLKADGIVYAKDEYKYWGYAWNTNNFQMVNTYDSFKNYICCVALAKDGKAATIYSDDKSKRGRTAIGRMPNGELVIYCSKDGTSDAKTPQALQKFVLDNGWQDAVMLDGGGSSQCITPSGKITSTRKVHNVLCFWIDDDAKDYATEQGETDVNGLKVKAYSKSKDGNKKVSANFTVKEFGCMDSDAIFIADELVEVLQKIRTYFGKPVIVNSSYRTHTRNKAVGGVANSMHLYGAAADIYIKGVTPKQIADYAEKLLPNKGGIGIYSTFVHVDVRATKSRWKG